MDSGLRAVSESVLQVEYHVKEKISKAQGSQVQATKRYPMALSAHMKNSLDRATKMLDVNKRKAILATRVGPSLNLLSDSFPDTGIHPATQELHQFRGMH